MKKHILGIAVFSFIVISAFFLSFKFVRQSALIPVFTYIDDYISIDKSDITCKILSAKYDSTTNEFTQEVKFYWKGNGKPTTTFPVNSYISTSTNTIFSFAPTVNVSFDSDKTATVLIVKHLDNSLDPKQNYYANIGLFDEDSFDSDEFRALVKSSPILFAH